MRKSALIDDLHTNTQNHLLSPATTKTSMTFSSTASLTLILKERMFRTTSQANRSARSEWSNPHPQSGARKNLCQHQHATKSLLRCHFSTSQSHAQRVIDAAGKFYFQFFSQGMQMSLVATVIEPRLTHQCNSRWQIRMVAVTCDLLSVVPAHIPSNS